MYICISCVYIIHIIHIYIQYIDEHAFFDHWSAHFLGLPSLIYKGHCLVPPVDQCKKHSSSELSSHISVELACARIIPKNMRCRGCAQEKKAQGCIKNHQNLDCALFGMNMMNIQKDPSYFAVNSRVSTTAITVSTQIGCGWSFHPSAHSKQRSSCALVLNLGQWVGGWNNGWVLSNSGRLKDLPQSTAIT
jgi:hypothetical protein